MTAQRLVDPMTVPMAAGPIGNAAADPGVLADGQKDARGVVNSASNDVGTANASGTSSHAGGIAKPVAAKAATMSHAPAATPAGIKGPTTGGFRVPLPSGVKIPAGVACKRPSGNAGSTSTTGSPKKQKMDQVCTRHHLPLHTYHNFTNGDVSSPWCNFHHSLFCCSQCHLHAFDL